jgi:hypothetical protein
MIKFSTFLNSNFPSLFITKNKIEDEKNHIVKVILHLSKPENERYIFFPPQKSKKK